MRADDLAWWGRAGTAHHIPDITTMRTACGRTIINYRHQFVRLDPRTGEPWHRCTACVRALAKRTSHPISTDRSDQ